jgi:AraC-like DNA-binding protein
MSHSVGALLSMARTASITFDDLTSYQTAIRPAAVEMFVTAKGSFRGQLTHIQFDKLWVQSACENLPRVAHSALAPNRACIAFLADAKQPASQYCGMDLPSEAIVIGPPSSSRHVRISSVCRWVSMTLPVEDLSAASYALVRCELTGGSLTRVMYPNGANMARLVRLRAAAQRLAEVAPDALAQAEVSNALEHELVHAMVGCLADEVPAKPNSGWRHHTAIINRFEEFLAANSDRPMHLAQICKAVGASERTLENCCEEHLGVGPTRYLWLRRMHLARRALIHADPSNTTVTQIASGYGFWELGRFAVSYKRLFGESPSASLRRPAGDLQNINRPLGLADSESA